MKNKTAISWKFLKYLVWFGPGLIIMGLSAGFVSGSWQPVPIGLIIAGFVIIALGLLFQGYFQPGDSKKHPYWSRRSTQAGTNVFVATVSALIIIGLINFIAVRNPVKIDLTENQQFTLAPQTQTLLTTLEKPMKVWVFDRGQNPQIKEILDRYRQIAPETFSYEFVDPQLQFGIAQEFGVTEFGKIYLESGEKRQPVIEDELDVFDEAKLTNAIEQILSDRKPKIYFLAGHGERSLEQGEGSLSEAVQSLNEKNFITESLNLVQKSAIPEDADVIVVAGPQRKLFEEEVEVIKDFLDQGGGVLLMIDPKTDPGLDDLLEEWGVKLDDRLAIDATGSGRLVGLGPTVPIVREYGEHPITQDFTNGISFYPYSRPVESRTVEGITESPLIWTEQQSWAESNLNNRDIEFDPQTDREGPLSLGVALTRSLTPAETEESNEENNQDTSATETSQTEEETESETAETTAEETTEENREENNEVESETSATETSQTEAETESETAETTAEEKTKENVESDTSTTEASETKKEEKTDTEASQTEAENQETAETENTNSEARLVVLGNSQFATNGWFEQQLNGDVFINSVSWLTKPDLETLSIRPKPVTNRRIVITPVLGRSLSWVALVILPLLGFFMGGIIWWRRR